MKKTKVIRSKEDLEKFNRWTAKFKLDKPIEITIGPYVKRRSSSQNALMWVWLHEIASETGNEAADLHEFFKKRFLPPEQLELFQEMFYFYTTRLLETVDFTEYLNKIEAFVASELGIQLTQPGWRESGAQSDSVEEPEVS